MYFAVTVFVADMGVPAFAFKQVAFPAMGESKQSRALYGVDVMFQVDDCEGALIITPKLTEVTFCPANNAICDAYVRDDGWKLYNKEIFECLFLETISNNIARLK